MHGQKHAKASFEKEIFHSDSDMLRGDDLWFEFCDIDFCASKSLPRLFAVTSDTPFDDLTFMEDERGIRRCVVSPFLWKLFLFVRGVSLLLVTRLGEAYLVLSSLLSSLELGDDSLY